MVTNDRVMNMKSLSYFCFVRIGVTNLLYKYQLDVCTDCYGS